MSSQRGPPLPPARSRQEEEDPDVRSYLTMTLLKIVLNKDNRRKKRARSHSQSEDEDEEDEEDEEDDDDEEEEEEKEVRLVRLRWPGQDEAVKFVTDRTHSKMGTGAGGEKVRSRSGEQDQLVLPASIEAESLSPSWTFPVVSEGDSLIEYLLKSPLDMKLLVPKRSSSSSSSSASSSRTGHRDDILVLGHLATTEPIPESLLRSLSLSSRKDRVRPISLSLKLFPPSSGNPRFTRTLLHVRFLTGSCWLLLLLLLLLLDSTRVLGSVKFSIVWTDKDRSASGGSLISRKKNPLGPDQRTSSSIDPALQARIERLSKDRDAYEKRLEDDYRRAVVSARPQSAAHPVSYDSGEQGFDSRGGGEGRGAVPVSRRTTSTAASEFRGSQDFSPWLRQPHSADFQHHKATEAVPTAVKVAAQYPSSLRMRLTNLNFSGWDRTLLQIRCFFRGCSQEYVSPFRFPPLS